MNPSPSETMPYSTKEFIENAEKPLAIRRAERSQSFDESFGLIRTCVLEECGPNDGNEGVEVFFDLARIDVFEGRQFDSKMPRKRKKSKACAESGEGSERRTNPTLGRELLREQQLRSNTRPIFCRSQ
jgi:hypothetical protein